MKKLIFSFLLLLLFHNICAQNNDGIIKDGIKNDSLFWQAYNTCNVDEMMHYIPNDIEFYHDKNGIQKGSTEFKHTFQKNLCSNPDFRLRREASPHTVKAFPMKNGDSVYGLIISGEHFFYISEKGKKERKEGLAKFNNLWLLENGTWKMSRVLSYDHGPAPYINSRKEIKLTNTILNTYKGKYNSVKIGIITIVPQESTLSLTIGNKTSTIYPENQNTFFMKERDLTFKFIKNEKNKITQMNVYENGELIEEDKIKE